MTYPRTEEVILSHVLRGGDVEGDPRRNVLQVHTKAGEFIAERDFWAEEQEGLRKQLTGARPVPLCSTPGPKRSSTADGRRTLSNISEKDLSVEIGSAKITMGQTHEVFREKADLKP